MFDHTHYVPALKAKAGEFGALRQLFPPDKAALTPILDVTPVPWNFTKDAPACSLDEHLGDVPEAVVAAWGGERPFFADLGLIEAAARMANGTHPVDSFFAACAAAGLRAVPVSAPDRDAAHQGAVRTVVGRDGRGVCFRLTFAHAFQSPAATLQALTTAALGRPLDAAAASQIDLVLDLGEVAEAHVPMYAVTLPQALQGLPHLQDWRSLTLLGGSFPSDLSGIPTGTRRNVPRLEWPLWTSLRARHLPRTPTFGDYGAHNPELVALDMRVIQPSATIRYTTMADWAVFRGQGVRNHGYGQFRTLSAQLMADAVYMGPAFSFGDRFIHDCANNIGGTGNLPSWVTVAANHHMTYVVRQIASLPGLAGVAAPPPAGPP